MPRPRSLTAEGIARAALAVIDADGLDALTMRSVAARLGVGTMSLYRYVTSRDDLERAVLDVVLGGVDTHPPAALAWDERIAVLARRVRDVLRAHPAVVPLVLTRRHANATTVRWGEAVLGSLAEAGLDATRRAIALRTLYAYVLGAVQAEHFGPLAGEGTAALAALPRDEFPLLAETAQHARTIAPDEEFERGLELFLRGLRGQ